MWRRCRPACRCCQEDGRWQHSTSPSKWRASPKARRARARVTQAGRTNSVGAAGVKSCRQSGKRCAGRCWPRPAISRSGRRKSLSRRTKIILSCRHPRKRVIQYSRVVVIESRSRGVLDIPLEPVIGLAEGETRWRGMTALNVAVSEPNRPAFTPEVHIQPRFRSQSCVVPRRGPSCARNAR
jgi:hypothetical protein